MSNQNHIYSNEVSTNNVLVDTKIFFGNYSIYIDQILFGRAEDDSFQEYIIYYIYDSHSKKSTNYWIIKKIDFIKKVQNGKLYETFGNNLFGYCTSKVDFEQ
jgi:hypothetical protein